MSWLRNLGTGSKLALSFGLMAALIVLAGVVGVGGMAKQHASLTALYEQHAVGVSHIKDANFSALATQGAVRAALLDERATKWQSEAKRRDADFKRAIAAYRATRPGDAALAKAGEAETLFKELREVQDTMFELVRGGSTVQALGMWANLDPLLEALNAVLLELSAQKVLEMETTAEETNASYLAARNVVLGTMAAALVAAGLLAWLITRLISRPLRQTVTVLQSVAEGDFTARLEVRSRDEVGHMAAALNQALDAIGKALQEVSGAANDTAGASRQMTAAAESMASGAQEQAASLEETAASLEEITSTLRQTAENSRKASEVALGSRSVAEKGGADAAATVQAMQDINQASRKIVDIIATIDDIAFQTNILALNAAVEAARAGEQGRGFAVVAAEVRSLAQRSAASAKEIKALIQDSVAKVAAGTALVNRSGESLEAIVRSAKQVNDIVAEIAAAANEQAQGIDQVSGAVAQMEQLTQRNAAQTEEISATAEGLSNQAQQMQRLVSRFKVVARAEAMPEPVEAVPEPAEPVETEAARMVAA